MKLVLLAAVVAFVCYISILDPVDAQDPTTTAATPPKNKTCGKGRFKGKKRPARAIRGGASVHVGPGEASASASAGGGGGGGNSMTSAVVKGGKDAVAVASAGGKKIQASIKDGVTSILPKKPSAKPPK